MEDAAETNTKRERRVAVTWDAQDDLYILSHKKEQQMGNAKVVLTVQDLEDLKEEVDARIAELTA